MLFSRFRLNSTEPFVLKCEILHAQNFNRPEFRPLSLAVSKFRAQAKESISFLSRSYIYKLANSFCNQQKVDVDRSRSF